MMKRRHLSAWQRMAISLSLFGACLMGAMASHAQELKPGDPAPLIRLPSPGGDTVNLSSFSGKLVLIDFWATWCAPCVKEQPELANLYEKYRNAAFVNANGFEIFGVSFDSKKDLWTEGIRNLKIGWTQVSDLKFWASPVAESYNIPSLPFNVLIDGKGIILAVSLHGPELENFLEGLRSK